MRIMPDINDVFQVPEVPVPVPVREAPVSIYSRQESLGLSTPTVSLIGTGGVGCWVALSLVLGGVNKIDLYDGDKLSIHNLNRFPLPPGAVGEMKSLALARWLLELRPEAEVVARGEFIPGVHILATDWIVCATDNLESRRAAYELATTTGASKYLEVGAEGEKWSLSPTPPEFSTELEARPGYQTVPVHVGPCMMAGAAVSYYVLHNQTPPSSISASWEKGPVVSSSTEKLYGTRDELGFSMMGEAKPYPDDLVFLRCPFCKRDVQRHLITLIAHLREDRPGMGLVEARQIAEEAIRLFDSTNLILAAGDQVANAVHVSEVGDWDEEGNQVPPPEPEAVEGVDYIEPMEEEEARDGEEE